MDQNSKKDFLFPVGIEDNYQPLLLDPIGRNSFCGHVGPSMNPTLTARDLLEIAPYTSDRKPRVGDVILLLPPELDFPVVHRIFRISSRGIRTRGDNSGYVDPWYLENGNIYGRVIGAGCGSRQRKIAGGLPGRLIGRYCRIRRLCMTRIVNLLRPVYRSLCSGGILNRLIPVRLSPRLVTFNSGSNFSHKLLLDRRVIGTYDQGLRQWQISRPYRVLVNESCLPAPR